jgi:phenylpyruvate tautomerase PptA (4-oxalocrotonate tautomerase family)
MEAFVMVTLQHAAMGMGGDGSPAVFAEVRSLGGLGPDVNAALSKALCDLFSGSLAVPPARVYINFADLQRSDWGWDGKTF